MGNAYSDVTNDSDMDFWVVTFNHADVVYWYYKNLSYIGKGLTQRVECAAGRYIRVGIVYRTGDLNRLCYKAWLVRNGHKMTVTKCTKSGDVHIMEGHSLIGNKSIEVNATTLAGVKETLDVAQKVKDLIPSPPGADADDAAALAKALPAVE